MNTIYRAEDGCEFNTQAECEIYEEKIRLEELRKTLEKYTPFEKIPVGATFFHVGTKQKFPPYSYSMIQKPAKWKKILGRGIKISNKQPFNAVCVDLTDDTLRVGDQGAFYETDLCIVVDRRAVTAP